MNPFELFRFSPMYIRTYVGTSEQSLPWHSFPSNGTWSIHCVCPSLECGPTNNTHVLYLYVYTCIPMCISVHIPVVPYISNSWLAYNKTTLVPAMAAIYGNQNTLRTNEETVSGDVKCSKHWWVPIGPGCHRKQATMLRIQRSLQHLSLAQPMNHHIKITRARTIEMLHCCLLIQTGGGHSLLQSREGHGMLCHTRKRLNSNYQRNALPEDVHMLYGMYVLYIIHIYIL